MQTMNVKLENAPRTFERQIWRKAAGFPIPDRLRQQTIHVELSFETRTFETTSCELVLLSFPALAGQI